MTCRCKWYTLVHSSFAVSLTQYTCSACYVTQAYPNDKFPEKNVTFLCAHIIDTHTHSWLRDRSKWVVRVQNYITAQSGTKRQWSWRSGEKVPCNGIQHNSDKSVSVGFFYDPKSEAHRRLLLNSRHLLFPARRTNSVIVSQSIVSQICAVCVT